MGTGNVLLGGCNEFAQNFFTQSKMENKAIEKKELAQAVHATCAVRGQILCLHMVKCT